MHAVPGVIENVNSIDPIMPYSLQTPSRRENAASPECKVFGRIGRMVFEYVRYLCRGLNRGRTGHEKSEAVRGQPILLIYKMN